MKKVIRKRVHYLTGIYRLSRGLDLPFVMYMQLLKQQSDSKRLSRKCKRYGSYLDWDSSEMNDLGLSVKQCSNKDDEVICIQIFLSQHELPKDMQHLWKVGDKV